MSNKYNEELLLQASELMDYWTGTMHERILQRDIDSHDYEALQYHLSLARAEMAIQEDSAIVDMPNMSPSFVKSRELYDF